MAPLKVSVKHAGKTHELNLDTDQPPAAFKDLIYQATGVPVDRMKVMAKGTVLKVCKMIYVYAGVHHKYV
jgi:ubiquitin carboxyl-terminal hydrolase 14